MAVGAAARLLDRVPDALRRERHVEVLDAERRERVTTAFTTAWVEAMVPASPMPLAPCGVCGAGVTVRSSSMKGICRALGTT